MRRVQLLSFATILSLTLSLTACGQPQPATEPAAEPTATAVAAIVEATATTAPAAEATPEATEAPIAAAEVKAGENTVEPFDASNFAENSAEISNQWIPMKPGTRYVYEGTTVEDDGTVVPHRVEIHFTDLTKVIGGIRSTVTWDLDYGDGELVEAELAFFAQDKDGNVWRMGEYPEEYDGSSMIANPAWIHGLQDAQAGIMMKADPQPGSPSYSEGWGPAVGWTDRGQVDQVGQKVCVPVSCYEDVLVIAETSQSEVDAFQLKSYAPNVGNVHVGWRGAGEKTQEVLELTLYEEVSPEALTEIRNSALKLEASALANSPEVYALTTPIELPAGVEAPASAPAEPPAAVADSGSSAEIVVYAADLPEDARYEMDLSDDPAAVGGKLIDLPNLGDELDPPPENDPHVSFPIQVEEGLVYRCWIHMRVGAPKGVSTANVVYVQIEEAEDENENVILLDNSGSYLTAQGPETEGWAWVPCDFKDAPPADSLIRFGTTGSVMVRIQAGMEGVGFDQFVLSSANFLENPPTESVVEK